MPKAKLTAAAVERLKAPPTGQVDYFDSAYPGLALRVSASGVRSWVYFGRVHGKLRRVTLGRSPAMNLAEARRKAGETAENMRQGVNPTTAKRIAAGSNRDTAEAVIAEWLTRDQGQNRSKAEVERVFARNILPEWRGRKITTITRRDALDITDAVADRGAVTMARRLHAHLHRLFRWCVGRGIIEANPMADAPKPGAIVSRNRVLTEAELAVLWRAAGALPYPFGPIFKLLMLTAARREEIGALRWAEVNDNQIQLAGDRSKNGEPRAIPLSPPAMSLLAAVPRMARSPYVFTTTGNTPVSGWSRAKEVLNRTAAEINGGPLAPWRIHDIRRSAATGLQRLGVGLQTIETVLGHIGGSRAGVVGTYQRHAFEAESRAALQMWAREIARIGRSFDDR